MAKCDFCRNYNKIGDPSNIEMALVDYDSSKKNAADGVHDRLLVSAQGKTSNFHINYCPMCGRKLRGEERYEFIRDGKDIWYVDSEDDCLVHGLLTFIIYRDNDEMYAFYVEWDEDGDGYYEGSALGQDYFLNKDDALKKLKSFRQD